MGKKSSQYVCSECGAKYSAWSGKCANCNQWNTIVEHESDFNGISKGKSLTVTTVKEVKKSLKQERILSGDAQLDTVLGGGFVPGGVVLLAGQPGIGKSTLLLQIAQNVSKKVKVGYFSGEESLHQIADRAERIGSQSDKLFLVSSGSTDDIIETMQKEDFDVVVVDSIQTISCQDITSAAGTVSQITNSTYRLSTLAKRMNVALLVVGHVTKEGSIAGPKVLEHSVDAVLQLEGDRYGGFKILRSVKNRFGPTNESAIYDMHTNGLQPVDNPSEALLAERLATDGSVVLATMEGTRPLLVEVQALVNKTAFGYPKRAASGFDLSRLHLLIAVLERRTKLSLADKDIYINVVGGLQINEPAADLAICMAVASAAKGMVLKENVAVFGELGLSGELRHVPYIDKRVKEIEKLGFTGAVGPKYKSVSSKFKYYTVKNLADTLNQFLQ